MPSVGAPVRMPLAVSEIRTLDRAGDLAGRSGSAGDEADVGEILLVGAAIRGPGEQPQRPQFFICKPEPARQELLFGDRGVLEDFVKPSHRSGGDRRGLGDAPNVGDHGVTRCFQGASVGAFGDSSGASDPHARSPRLLGLDRVNFNGPAALLLPSPPPTLNHGWRPKATPNFRVLFLLQSSSMTTELGKAAGGPIAMSPLVPRYRRSRAG